MKVVRCCIMVWLLGLGWLPHAGWAASFAYQVEMPKLDPDLSALLPALSDCINLHASPPPTRGLLIKRMHGDQRTFTEALKSKGYFAADVQADVDTQTTPPTVRFAIDPGPRFVFGMLEIAVEPEHPDVGALLRPVLGAASPGLGYASAAVLDAEDAMLERLREHGYPWPSMGARQVVADHDSREVRVRFAVNPGPRAVFGALRVEGLDAVREETVRHLLTWNVGEIFDQRKIDAAQEQLIRCGLFRSVRVSMQAESQPGEVVPMVISVMEAAPRTVRAGLWYYLDQGVGASAGWTHRNVWGGGEEFSVDTEIGQYLQKASSTLSLPRMGHPDQALHLSAGYEHELTDVYESREMKVASVVRRDFDEFQADCGLAYRLSEIDKNERIRRFNLLSVPLGLAWDNVENPLDPVSGFALSVQTEPFMTIGDEGAPFVLWNLNARHYLSVLPRDTLVLATRARYSLLAGAGHDDIPEDLLLYAGGGGSIRGYAYQYAGPLNDDDEPEGGMSAVDFSAELRWRINQDYGAVAFMDGGGAFSGQNPELSDAYFWGAGVGLRYFTPIGPIRFDVAVPLNRRSGVDDPFQLYISLGQAF